MARGCILIVIAMVVAAIAVAQPEASASTFGWGPGHGGFITQPPIPFQCQPLPTLSGNSEQRLLYALRHQQSLNDRDLVPALLPCLLLLVTMHITLHGQQQCSCYASQTKKRTVYSFTDPCRLLQTAAWQLAGLHHPADGLLCQSLRSPEHLLHMLCVCLQAARPGAWSVGVATSQLAALPRACSTGRVVSQQTHRLYYTLVGLHGYAGCKRLQMHLDRLRPSHQRQ
jgi:hypothetical protein